jgi:tetratricopeptide (TPR) repeat protein
VADVARATSAEAEGSDGVWQTAVMLLAQDAVRNDPLSLDGKRLPFMYSHYNAVLAGIPAHLASELALVVRLTTNMVASMVAPYISSQELSRPLSIARLCADRALLLGPRHPLQLEARLMLGVVLVKMQQFSEAQQIFQDVLNSVKGRLDARHSLVLKVRHRLAVLMRRQGRLDEAEREFMDLLEIHAEKSGKDHIFTRRTAECLEAVHRDRNGDWKKDWWANGGRLHYVEIDELVRGLHEPGLWEESDFKELLHDLWRH